MIIKKSLINTSNCAWGDKRLQCVKRRETGLKLEETLRIDKNYFLTVGHVQIEIS